MAALSSGTRLGPYEVVEAIGAGGMVRFTAHATPSSDERRQCRLRRCGLEREAGCSTSSRSIDRQPAIPASEHRPAGRGRRHHAGRHPHSVSGARGRAATPRARFGRARSNAPRWTRQQSGRGVFVSPDGNWVGYFAGSVLQKVSILGGPPVTICERPDGVSRGAIWGVDDTIVFATGASSGLWRVPTGGGAANFGISQNGSLVYNGPCRSRR